jgi:RHS repeat-associated protein
VCDGDSVRRKRLDQNGTVHYPGRHYERNVGNGATTAELVTKHYRALGRLIAVRRNGTLYWVGTDHLGSSIRVADATFAAVDQLRYLPFGGGRDSATNLPTDHRYTSQIEDQSTGLYWYAARAYDPALGRFICPDALVPAAGNPQNLNRYSYVGNNPLGSVDPTGHVGQQVNAPVGSRYMGDKVEADGRVMVGEYRHYDWGSRSSPSTRPTRARSRRAWPRHSPAGATRPHDEITCISSRGTRV